MGADSGAFSRGTYPGQPSGSQAGARRAIFTRYPGTRAAPPVELASLWRRCTAAPAELIEEPEQAFRRAVGLAGVQGVVVVTGSIHLAGCLRPIARVRECTTALAGTAPRKLA